MSTPVPHLHAVVLAGGSGARFWPLSRELFPKQMLSMFGDSSLIAQAISRVAPLVAEGTLTVLSGEQLVHELEAHVASQEALSGLDIGFLAEPAARNTAPAVALAAAYLLARDPDAIMVMLPSDHVVVQDETWRDAVRVAAMAAARGYLVTVGLTPNAPETGYGYIQSGERIAGLFAADLHAHTVARFVEKPDLETAQGFLADGGYLWNSGILVAQAATVLAELCAAGDAAVTPESSGGRAIAETARWLATLPAEEWTGPTARERFEALDRVPFDKAALEVSQRVAVVPVTLDWSDVGSLDSLEELGAPDERGNVLLGRAFDIGSRGVIAYAGEHVVATLGLDDVIVVQTPDATLVADRSRTQDVRLVVDALKAIGAPEVVSSNTTIRSWGSWTVLLQSGGFQIRSVEVLPGGQLSLQRHSGRSEHWVVVEGEALVERDGETVRLGPNESAYVPQGCSHRLANPGELRLRAIEVAVGECLEEDDVERCGDERYGP